MSVSPRRARAGGGLVQYSAEFAALGVKRVSWVERSCLGPKHRFRSGREQRRPPGPLVLHAGAGPVVDGE